MFGCKQGPSNYDKLYEVDEIVGYRFDNVNKRNEYLVRWKGNNGFKESWEEYNKLTFFFPKLQKFFAMICEGCGASVQEYKIDDPICCGIDLLLTPEDGKIKSRYKRVIPPEQESGMACGWNPRRILGWQNQKNPHTYLVEYNNTKQVEHLPVRYVAKKCPELVKKFHDAIKEPYPYSPPLLQGD
uniref:Chromo domain-containing protein n=1 Tax=Syphacia muris TaxID=451379 RepID=A0A0N5AXN4_9BILA